ncbi:RHS repeat-associated core domain-containing protein [Archangium violaceum]|uniref:RHS repeat-associated core domain-containing protein n=1 Tax=Archangium violaceum TaxID=83451 RepID=UPI002B2BDE88|nr:RHS repeat-associated core domain-containing protein [Archangium violaceum]
MRIVFACFCTLGLLLLPSVARAQQLCSPFDSMPATSGGPLGDVAACCDGESTDEGCGPCRCAECGDEAKERNVGRPVDMLSGFAWLERTDVDIDAPRGPDIRFMRTYSTHWAQSRGGRDEIGRLGPGWTDTYGARLVLDGSSPPHTVKYRKADTGTENFNLQEDGTYAARLPGRRLFFDASTQHWVLEKFDASYEVFDTNGRLVHLRGQDGGEAHLVYTGEAADCPVAAARPAGTLCRVEFLFGHKLWLRYHSTAYPGARRLASISWDAAGTQLLAQYAYDTSGYLTTATRADNRRETYTYDYIHRFPDYPGQSVALLTAALEDDQVQVEAFSYVQHPGTPSRVATHLSPDGRYTFSYGMTRWPRERSTEVRGTRENLRITWENGKLKTVCYLNQNGACDMSRLMEMTVPGTGVLAPTCQRGFDGYYTRYLRDALGRRTSELPGLVDCANPTAQEALHEVRTGYVANSNHRAYTARVSVDPTAPAGTSTFTVYDYTSPSSAINPLCGNASCQTPTAYNTPASALTAVVNQRVRVGRTLANTAGAWETRVEVTKYTYNTEGLLQVEDGPWPGTDDALTYEYYDALGPTSSAGRLKRVFRGTRLLAEYSDYNDRGQFRRRVDANGQVTTYTYDEAGRVLTEQGPEQTQPIRYIYSTIGRLAEVQYPRGNRLLFSYDTSGRLSSVGQTTIPSGTPATFDEEVTYEWGNTNTDAGHLLSESYSREGNLARTTTYNYDAQGRRATVHRLRSQTQAALRLTTFNERGDIVSTRVGTSTKILGEDDQELESSTTYLYDNLQRLARISSTSQEFRYDWHDNLVEVDETLDLTGSGNYPRTFYSYDDFGRLVEVRGTTFGTRRYVYDMAGNLVQELKPNGEELTYTYDAQGRRTGLSGPSVPETYTYDTDAAANVLDCATGTPLGASHGVGLLTSVTDASGTTYFGYTFDGWPRFEARLAPGATCARAMHWEYDGNGQRTSVRYPSGITLHYQHPPAGQPHMHLPSAVQLTVGNTSVTLATDLVWEAGALTQYTAGNGFTWHFSRWLDGSPSEWKVTRGEYEEVVRRRAFSEDTGQPEPRLDGRGSPLRIEEDDTAWTRDFTYQEETGYLASDSRDGLTQLYGYTGWRGDRQMRMTGADPLGGAMDTSESYSYDETTFLLTQAQDFRLSPFSMTTRGYTYGPGGEVTEATRTEGSNSRSLALCYDSKSQVAALVGAGGQYTRQVFNFRHQRVREVWPVNGLVTDYWVDNGGTLLAELGAASLTAQYPRPVGEYVYLGGQPIARVDSVQAEDGTTTFQGVTYLFGGHQGELLMEADMWGHVVRNYDYSPFGARTARSAPTQTLDTTLSRSFIPATQVLLQAPSSATLRFKDFAIAACDSVAVVDEEGNLLKRLRAGQPASFQTESLPAQGSYLQVWLERGTCTGSSSLTLAQVQPSWGRAQQKNLEGYESPHPYPAAGHHVSLSLPANTHLLVEAHPASCDTLEVRRSGTGQVLWSWPADSSFFRTAWTPALSGDVDVGIWSTQGCNQTQGKQGYFVRRMYTRLPAGAPANIHLPGQRFLTAAASSRRGAFNEPEADLFENWYRVFDPAIGRYLQPDPLLALGPERLAPYAYANNNPLLFTDPTGLMSVSPCDVNQLPSQDSSIGPKGEMKPSPNDKIQISCSATGEMSIALNNRGCRINFKYPPGDPRYAEHPRPTTFEEVITHERGHVADFNDMLSSFAARYEKYEGKYCSLDECMKVAKEIVLDFEADWQETVRRTREKWGDPPP